MSVSRPTRTHPRITAPQRPGVRPILDVDALIADRSIRIIVCCGAGGVGKTTTSAALALRAAEQGRDVVVLTIDPARRLAQSMGIEVLDNIPRRVPGVEGRGRLDAMMLDMKRTFDDVVLSQASPEKAKQILENPFYIAVSSSFAGTQEYMAMEKLGQLDRDAQESGCWDLIVVDTPPSRSALDFLDSPERLASFLDGKFMKMLTAPARGPAKLMSAGFGLVTKAVTALIGAQVLADMQAFVAAFDTLFGGFRQRAQRTYNLLKEPGTAFIVVTAPEPDALREAAYFVEQLRGEQMPLAGVVLNRFTADHGAELSEAAARAAAEKLRDSTQTGVALARGLLRLHADKMVIAQRELNLRERFSAGHSDVAIAVVPALPGDIHDLDGLRVIGDLVAAQQSR